MTVNKAATSNLVSCEKLLSFTCLPGSKTVIVSILFVGEAATLVLCSTPISLEGINFLPGSNSCQFKRSLPDYVNIILYIERQRIGEDVAVPQDVQSGAKKERKMALHENC